MIQGKSTKKDSENSSSHYQVVLGSFVVKEKQILRAGSIVNLSRKISQEKKEEKFPSSYNRRSNFSISKFVAWVLLAFMVGNPIIPVFADELPPDFSDLAGVQASNEIITDESVVPPVTETEAINKISTTTEITELPATDMTTTEIATTAEIATTSEIATTTESQPPQKETLLEQIIGVVTDFFAPADTMETVNETATSTEEIQITEPPAVIATSTEEIIVLPEETATSTNEMITIKDETDSIVSEAEATTTVPEIILSEEVTTTKTLFDALVIPEEPTPIAQPKVFFKDNECTPTDDGGYYCVSSKLSSSTEVTNIVAPRIYAKAGVNDDKEIYYEDANGKIQITFNEYDDDAPSYDEHSQIILWHALINGRYQIMFYDKSSAGTGFRQLTDTGYNNTNPYISGKSAVWQGWVNNNWEIFYVKDVTAPSLEIRQITGSVENDMFPHLSEKFITWQSFFEDTWHVFVYDMEKGETSQITKTIDGKYENPRFALLFEKRDENGVVQTIGYDIASGQEIPINHGNSSPGPLSLPQADNDKAMPLQSSATTTTVKTPEKDGGEGGE